MLLSLELYNWYLELGIVDVERPTMAMNNKADSEGVHRHILAKFELIMVYHIHVHIRKSELFKYFFFTKSCQFI